jgi:hypothetical protein
MLEKEKEDALNRLRFELEAAAAKDKAAALASLEATLRVRRARARFLPVQARTAPAFCPCSLALRGAHAG